MRYFQHDGYEVDTAATMEDAIARLERKSYDLAICDVQLATDHEGLHVIAFARELSPRMRLILLTARATRAIEQEAVNLGVDAFLRKPIPLGELAQIVSVLLLERKELSR